MTLPALILGLFLGQSTTPETPYQQDEDAETLIDLDLKDANVLDILRLLAKLGDFNLVVDPDVQCRFTLTLKAVDWRQVMELSLRSCRLGEDRLGENLVRVAPLEQLTREQQERRKHEEERSLAGPLRTTYRRLSYARARDLAPLLQKSLSPRGQIAFDERTNTLIITDIAR
jgi:type IV pilus assembly protein PilQ